MKNCGKIISFVVLLCDSRFINSWPPALQNCGATCFLNASIQVLYNIRPLTDIVVKNENTYPEGSVSYYYKNLIKEFEKNKNEEHTYSCAAGEGLKELDGEAYKLIGFSCGQQDATEFLIKFLDWLIEQSNYIFNDKIKNLFNIREISIFSCPEKTINGVFLERYISEKTEYYPTGLNIETTGLDVNQTFSTLRDCLAQFCKIELMNDPKSPYYDERIKQNRSDCTKQIMLGSSPEILMIGLKRFRFDRASKISVKLTHDISIPEELNIAEFIKGGTKDDPLYQYELIGFVRHAGGTRGGHYWAYVKDEFGKWYKCNDSSITIVSFGSSKADREQSYFVVYQKLSPEVMAKREAALKEEEARRKEQEQLRALQTDLNQLKARLQRLDQNLKAIAPVA